MGRNTKVKSKRKPRKETLAQARARHYRPVMEYIARHGESMTGSRVDLAAYNAHLAKINSGFIIPKAPDGKKLDSGKSPVTRGVLWYFPRALLAVADVSSYGANKYELALEDKNWMNVPDGFGRYADAQGRHLIKQAINPTDKESELRHAQMDAWNALAKLELLLVEEEKAGKVSYD